MLPCETHSTATRRPIPNDFDLADLNLVQLACRFVRMGARMGLTGEAWAGSSRASGTGRSRPRPSRGSAWPPGHARPAPPCLLRLTQAPQLRFATAVRRSRCRWRVCRRRVNGGRPQHLLNIGVDLPTTVGRASHVAMASWWCEAVVSHTAAAAALSRTQDRGPCHQYHTGGTWGSSPHGSGPRASTIRRFGRPRRAFRCAFRASNHARRPAHTRADTVNTCYKRAQVPVVSPRPAPAAAARPPAPVGSLPRPLAPPPAIRPPARSSSHTARARAETREGPRSCWRPRAGLWARAAAGIRPGRAPRSPTVPPACRVRSGSATVHIGPRSHAFTALRNPLV